MRIWSLVLGGMALVGCSSVWEPIERSNVVIAIVGFDEALKDRFSTKAPDGDEDVRLGPVFQQDTKGCTPNGYNDSRARLTEVAIFRESALLDVRTADGAIMHVRLFNAFSGESVPAKSPVNPGDYTFRDAGVSWYDGQWRHTRATSEEVSLSFAFDGQPVFLGLYAISMNARSELALTEVPAPLEVMAAAAERLGIAGQTLQAPQLRMRKLARCGPIGVITRSNTD